MYFFCIPPGKDRWRSPLPLVLVYHGPENEIRQRAWEWRDSPSTVTSVYFPCDSSHGDLRYNTADEAQAAKATLNGADLCGSSIVVDSWEKGRKRQTAAISGGNFHQWDPVLGGIKSSTFMGIWNNLGGIFFTYKQCRYVVWVSFKYDVCAVLNKMRWQTHGKKQTNSSQHNEVGRSFPQVKRLEAPPVGVF